MTQYQRVLLVDAAHVLPVAPFDYLMEASANGTLQSNVLIATRGDPCTTALVVVHPQVGDWERLQQMVAAAKPQSLALDGHEAGWGYNFQEHHDQWEAIAKNGTTWKFAARHPDQGE